MFAYLYICIYVYEPYFDYIVFHAHIENAKKKIHTKKEISEKSEIFIELWPRACHPPEILSVLVKISWKQKLNFPRSALFHMNTRVCLKYLGNDCGFFAA